MFSILTDDLEHCYISGGMPVALHHIFNKSDKKFSEKYGFLVPLRPDFHTTSNYSVHMNPGGELDMKLKLLCVEWWLNSGRTKEQWLQECSKWYEPEDKIKVPQIF